VHCGCCGTGTQSCILTNRFPYPCVLWKCGQCYAGFYPVFLQPTVFADGTMSLPTGRQREL
jgi:hypothetical protein